MIRAGIYAVDLASGNPSSLIADAGSIVATAVGDKIQTISVTLQPGVYFLVAVTNDATVRLRAIGNLGTAPALNPLNWFNQAAGPVENAARYRTFTGYAATAALPATATTAGAATVTTGDIPGFFLRAA